MRMTDASMEEDRVNSRSRRMDYANDASRSPPRKRSSRRNESRSRSRSYSRSPARPGRYTRERYTRDDGKRGTRREHSFSRYSPARRYSRSPPRRYPSDYNEPARYRSGPPPESSRQYQKFRRDPNAPAPPSEVIGIFGLDLDTTEADLKDIFEAHGPVDKINLIYDHDTGKSRGFGFIYFKNLEDAKSALEKTNGISVHGKVIRVDYSVTKRPHSPTPGMYMGRKSAPHNDRPRTSKDHPRRDRSYSRSRSRSR